MGTGVALLSWSGTAAQADCVPNNPASFGSVTCAPPGNAGFTAGGGVDNLTVTIVPGATVVDDGTQAIGINNSNTLTNNGTVSAVTNGTTGINAVDNNTAIVNNGSLNAIGDSTAALIIGSTNNVINSGTGTITVTGINAAGILSNGGNNITSLGTMVISGGGALGIASGPSAGGVNDVITNRGTMWITGTEAIGIFANNGQPTVNNFGTMNVSGTDGTGIVANGQVNLTNAGNINVTGTGAFGINHRTNGAGTFINSGNIVATGTNSEALRLTGGGFPTNGFFNNGLLQATGTGSFALRSATAGGFIPTVATVTNNATIDGRIRLNGEDDTLINNGLITVTSGNIPIGNVFTVTGGFFGGLFQQNAGGVLSLRVTSSATTYDFLTADFAQIAGVLRATIQPGLYGPVTTYLGVVATACVCVGNFDIAVATSPFFSATTTTDGTNIDLILTRIGFGAVPGLTKNQQAVGNALEPLYSTTLTGNAATLFSNLLAATSISALDQLSGEGTAALQNAAFNAGSLFNNASLSQLVFGEGSGATSVIVPPAQYAATPKPRGHEAFAAFKAPAQPPVAQTGRWRVWTLGFGGYRSIDGQAFPIGSANQTMRAAGGALGVDYQVRPDLLLGFAGGGSESNISVPDRATTGNITAGHFGIYGLKTWGSYYAAGSASYARLANSTTRTIAGIGPTETAYGRFSSDQISGRLELGWKRAFAQFNLTPFVAVEPAVLWARGYTETSTIAGGTPGILGLSFASRTTTSLPTFLGVQADGRVVMNNGMVVVPYGRLSWVHEFEPSRQVNPAFISVPGAAFTVDGARAASDAARLDTGAKVTLDTTRSLFANFSGEWSGTTASYAAMGGFRLTP